MVQVSVGYLDAWMEMYLAALYDNCLVPLSGDSMVPSTVVWLGVVAAVLMVASPVIVRVVV